MAIDYSYIASVDLWAGTYAPKNWAFCQGQLLPITSYQALYSLIGTIYDGDGTTTFGLPDMRGRIPVGCGQLPRGFNYTLGINAGAETATLTLAQMPVHNHLATFTPGSSQITGSLALPVNTDSTSGGNNPIGKYFGESGSTNLYYDDYTASSNMASVNIGITDKGGTVTLKNTGSTNSFSILQPYTVLNFIICLLGEYPPRN